MSTTHKNVAPHERATATVLLVDDDASNRDALSRRLESSGYTVLTAESGRHALELINGQRGHRVDAVLLDVMMPEMSGIETLRRLRLSRSFSDLPVIMVTADHTSADVAEALDLGANDYVTTPIDFPIVLARIRTQTAPRRGDPMTGLPTRTQFMDQLERRLARHRRGAGPGFAVFFLDIDRFKSVNDRFGHLAGDELLTSVARRLEGSLRLTDAVARAEGEHTLARLGGDEFTVLLDEVESVAAARLVADRLLAAVAQPFVVQGREILTSVSIGVVLSDPRYSQAEDMLRDADRAMYRAKTLGKARCELFDASMQAVAAERQQIEEDLRHALERQEMLVYYQPIISLAEGQLCGFEALLRWHHPARGVISPAEFIRVAEDSGLIIPIGHWVLREACRQMTAWDREFPEHVGLMINVNLSARQCPQPEMVRDVAAVLKETGLAPERLKLELTEGVMLDNSEAVVGILTALRALGVQLGLDNFGTGYSALGHLQRFPFQTLKIDRSFVSGVHDGANREIIRAIVSLAGGLAMNVTAGGVETAEQVASLRKLACEFGQGFYFYKPLAREDAGAVLRHLLK
jgi:Amt family ammonium transporter